jgi:hypothetical protein
MLPTRLSPLCRTSAINSEAIHSHHFLLLFQKASSFWTFGYLPKRKAGDKQRYQTLDVLGCSHRAGVATYLEEEDIPPRMDETPARNTAQADSKQPTKSATSTGSRDVNRGPESQLFPSIELAEHPDQAGTDTSFRTSQQEPHGIEALPVLHNRGANCQHRETEDQEWNPDVATDLLAKNIRWQFDHAVRHK